MLNKYQEIWNKIDQYNKITIFTHLNPDGDTIGTSIALKELIKMNFNNKEIKISGDKYPKNLIWLPQNDDILNEYIQNSLAILVDTSSIKRTFDKRILNAKEIIKIDHHHPEGNEWSLTIDGDNYPATGEILYEMIKHLDLKHKSNDLYTSLFISIWTDTSGLVERNPSKQTFEAIKWLEENGVEKEKIIKKISLSNKENKIIKNYFLNTKIENDFAYTVTDKILINYLYRPSTDFFFKNYEAQIYLFAVLNEKKKYRVGLRSKGYDVSKIVKKFGGGGHTTSAGVEVDTKKEVESIISYILKRNSNENA